MIFRVVSDTVQARAPDIAAGLGAVGTVSVWLAPINEILKFGVSVLTAVSLILAIRAHIRKRKD